MKKNLCDGCNVRKPFEHRCHGEGCGCDELSCMKRQGRITAEQHSAMISEWVAVKSGEKYQFPSLVEIDPSPGGDHRVVGQNGPVPLPLFWGTESECKKWKKENCV